MPHTSPPPFPGLLVEQFSRISRPEHPFTQLSLYGFGRGPSCPIHHHIMPTPGRQATNKVFTVYLFHPQDIPGKQTLVSCPFHR